ncbi:hypothetical protein BX666DRAFT_1857466 [Dichotomocladium elegans]|nr:hypothetical protein BX666DRAFT_1857466 [Dichotomocladium elegans]
MRKPLVFVDFDETITNKETTPLLGQFGLDRQKRDPPLPWSYFVDTYMHDYHRISASLPPGTGTRQRLEALRAAEIASIKRIEEEGVFKGLRRKNLWDQGRQLAPSCLRENVLEALGTVPSGRLHIISVNWSKDWILGFLGPTVACLSHDQIHSNELVFSDDDCDSTATGKITPHVVTSIDKEHKMARILHQETHDKHTPPSVYIGDSVGDLFPLLKADIGIVFGSNNGLLNILRSEFGVIIKESGLNSRKPGIYRVDSWTEIHDSGVLLAGPDETS